MLHIAGYLRPVRPVVLRALLLAAWALVVFAPVSAMADTWGDRIDDPTLRFTVLPGLEMIAVLDNETGLIWERFPSANTRNWGDAQVNCNQKILANRKGWRLPTLQELASLVDPSQTFPALPPGNPFGNVQSTVYFSATTVTGFPGLAWSVAFDGGFTGHFGKELLLPTWCVRGGQGVDIQ